VQNTAEKLLNKGWIAELELNFSRNKSKTFLSKRRHIGPLTVQRPFYPEDGVCHVYLLHPPGGIVGGDELTIKLSSDPYSDTLITTPGATKIYRTTKDRFSIIKQDIVVNEGATLEWLPMETIIFPGANSIFSTKFSLYGDAKIAAWEIQCLGRPAIDEKFDSGKLKFSFELWKDGRPAIIDRLKIDHSDINNIAGLRGFPVFGTFVLSSANRDILEFIRSLIPESKSYIAGATQIDDIVIIRCLALKTNLIQELFRNIWIEVRHLIFDREGIVPRIWLT